MHKTEIRLVCDLCGAHSPVLKDEDEPFPNWTIFQLSANHVKDFCCEAHKNRWLEEHAERVMSGAGI